MTAKAPAPVQATPATPAPALPASGGAYVLVDGVPTPETPSPADAPMTDPEA